MNKTPLLILGSILAIALCYIGILSAQKQHLELKLSLCNYQSINLEQALKEQNQALENIRLDTQKFKDNATKNKQAIISKITAIPAPVSKDGITCEDTIDYIIKLESLK